MTGELWCLLMRDRRDCYELKAELERTAREAGFVTKSSALPNSDFQVVNRLAIEELEAWFFGDVEAPGYTQLIPPVRVSINLEQYQARYRNPDAIHRWYIRSIGAFANRRKNYHTPKDKLCANLEVAQNIAQHMEPNRNKSKSFQVFVEGLKACVEERIVGVRNTGH